MQKQRARKHARKNQGFSLIELLIVVAIILIIAAIAIPNLLRSRMAANEASAVGSLRTLNTAEITYNTTYSTVGFTCTLGNLAPPASGTSATSSAAGLIDATLASGNKSGYTFNLINCSGSPFSTYQSTADPATVGTTGQRSFCSDNSGVIRQDGGGSSANCLTNNVPI